jgi:hypothetical protein
MRALVWWACWAARCVVPANGMVLKVAAVRGTNRTA